MSKSKTKAYLYYVRRFTSFTKQQILQNLVDTSRSAAIILDVDNAHTEILYKEARVECPLFFYLQNDAF